jgi:hypothetical protein
MIIIYDMLSWLTSIKPICINPTQIQAAARATHVLRAAPTGRPDLTVDMLTVQRCRVYSQKQLLQMQHVSYARTARHAKEGEASDTVGVQLTSFVRLISVASVHALSWHLAALLAEQMPQMLPKFTKRKCSGTLSGHVLSYIVD